MKLSIITPTHNPKFLLELQESILAQTHKDWEWVVVFNNGADCKLKKDKRIKKFYYTKETSCIGEIKNYAFSLGTGDALVEVDHDDLITPDCLEEIAQAFISNPNVGFVYSDNAKLGEFTQYNQIHGWKYSDFLWQGTTLTRVHSLPLLPYTLGYIWFLPDHVRAWRTETYRQLGGHNKTLEVCDDQELMIRTYLTSEFYHIDKCLYIYRITGENTSINKKNQLVQNINFRLYNTYIYTLSAHWADKQGLVKIDLCGGFDKPEGYLSVDLEGGDITADLNKRRPFADNSVGVIRAHDAIEHLKDPIHTMREVYRVLAPGGVFLSQTPSTDGRGARQDPTHVSFWNSNSFRYWVQGRVQHKYIRNYDCLFHEDALYTFFPTQWHKDNNIPYVKANLSKPITQS